MDVRGVRRPRRNRETFETIGTRQFVKGMLAEMRADMNRCGGSIARRLAVRPGGGERWGQSAAKLRGAQLSGMTPPTGAVRSHGGAGYVRSLPFEAEYRNARVTRIYDGTGRDPEGHHRRPVPSTCNG